MDDNKEKSSKLEEFSNPENISLVLDVEDIKIPQDTIDNREEVISQAGSAELSEYGRPQLNLTKEGIRKKHRKKDAEDLKYIDECHAKGEIDDETRDFLYDYFGNSSKIYNDFKNAINDSFGCSPKSIKHINLLDGSIDNETPYFDEHVGPDTTMVFEYEINAPWRLENKIPGAPMEHITVRVVMPMMKDVRRAVEKVKIGGKYDLERKKELSKLKPGQTPEEAGLDKAKLRTPLQKMKDILRCTVLAPRYDDILALYTENLENERATKSSRPSKYLDNDRKNAAAFFKNSKNYRDMKNYLHVISSKDGKMFFAEVQYKTDIQFFRADIKTHLEYEEARKHQQEFYNTITEGDKLVLNAKIYNRLLNIQKLNREAFDDYNLNVLQDMRRMEDRLKRAGVKPDKDGTYKLCRDLADTNILVRSSVALTDDTFKNTPAWVKDIYKRYSKNIDKKYLVDLRDKQSPISRKSKNR